MDTCSCCKKAELDMHYFHETDVETSGVRQMAFICPGGFFICYDCNEILESEPVYVNENACKSCIRDRKIGEILNEPLGM